MDEDVVRGVRGREEGWKKGSLPLPLMRMHTLRMVTYNPCAWDEDSTARWVGAARGTKLVKEGPRDSEVQVRATKGIEGRGEGSPLASEHTRI